MFAAHEATGRTVSRQQAARRSGPYLPATRVRYANCFRPSPDVKLLADRAIESAILIALAGFIAGLVNTVAGGGPIVTVAALLLIGLDARTANMTSTVGMIPGQIVAGWHGRSNIVQLGPPPIPRWAIAICLLGGASGAVALLLTPSTVFTTLMPWLVLFATVAYAISGRWRLTPKGDTLPAAGLLVPLTASAIYGGYYGGGNSFLVLALLAWRGLPADIAGRTKNLLIAIINAAAVVIFVASGGVDPTVVVPLAVGGIAGSLLGLRLLGRLSAAWLRAIVIGCGLAVSGWLFAAR